MTFDSSDGAAFADWIIGWRKSNASQLKKHYASYKAFVLKRSGNVASFPDFSLMYFFTATKEGQRITEIASYIFQ